MRASTKLTKSTVFSQLSNCCSRVLPVEGCSVTVYLSQGSALSQVDYDPQNSLRGGEENPQSSSRSLDTVRSRGSEVTRTCDTRLRQYYSTGDERQECVSDSAEQRRCRAEKGVERNGEGKGADDTKRDVQLCYSEGGPRVRSVGLKKGLHSEESREGTPAPTATSGMLPPGSVWLCWRKTQRFLL